MANSVYYLANPEVKGDVVDESLAMLRALALAAKILDYAKVRSWRDLGGELPPLLRLTESQAELVSRYEHLCAMMRSKTDDLPKVTVCVCSECSRWMLVATGGTKPSKCSLSVGCAGKIMSPPSTKKVTEQPDEIDDDLVTNVPASPWTGGHEPHPLESRPDEPVEHDFTRAPDDDVPFSNEEPPDDGPEPEPVYDDAVPVVDAIDVDPVMPDEFFPIW